MGLFRITSTLQVGKNGITYDVLDNLNVDLDFRLLALGRLPHSADL